MVVKKIYQSGKDGSCERRFLFVVNGKGEHGNGESWNDDDREVANRLGKFVERMTYANTPKIEGDTLVFYYNGACYVDFMDWKREMDQVYSDWKERIKKIENSGKKKGSRSKKSGKKSVAVRKV